MGKSVLSARIDEDIFKKFQAICKADRRSQATMLEIMIEGFQPSAKIQQTAPIQPMAIEERLQPDVSSPKLPKVVMMPVAKPTVKQTPEEPTMAELLKAVNKAN